MILNSYFKEFKLSQLDRHYNILVIGKKETCKSTLLANIMAWYKDIPSIVICPKPKGDISNHYPIFCHKKILGQQYKPDIVHTFIKYNADKSKPKSNYKGSLINFDECLTTGSYKDKELQELFMNGRHYNVTILTALQYSISIPPKIRSNYDYIFLAKDDIIHNIKRLYEHYAGMFPTFQQFNSTFNEITNKNKFMVVSNCSKSHKLEDKIYWYEPKINVFPKYDNHMVNKFVQEIDPTGKLLSNEYSYGPNDLDVDLDDDINDSIDNSIDDSIDYDVVTIHYVKNKKIIPELYNKTNYSSKTFIMDSGISSEMNKFVSLMGGYKNKDSIADLIKQFSKLSVNSNKKILNNIII